jgi:O-antigen/teichoic acid export membrane protein
MSDPPSHPKWAFAREHALHTLARNISTRYVTIVAEMIIGLLLLPFNLKYFGEAQYGLWILLGSVTVHFSLLEMGNGSAMVKFVAQYRALKDGRAINEIASSMAVVFGVIGLLAYALLAAVAFNLEHLFNITADDALLGQWILLIIGVHVTVNFPFSVYGGVTGGFQRYDINNRVAMVTTIVAALVNVAVVLAGGTLLVLVASTTAVRVAAYAVYAANAHRVFPELKVRPSLFSGARVREVMGFSAYTTGIDWANKLNYQFDQIIIGAFLGPIAVAAWAPAERIAAGIQRLTNQLNGVLFPLIVDSDATRQHQRLQQILVQGTRFSLAAVLPVAAAVFVLADPLMRVWLGSKADDVAVAVPVLQILAVAVAFRVGNATATTVLKGTGRHRMLAGVNLATGAVNVAMSAALISRFGLVGVAYGTLVPIATAAAVFLFPAACRHVGVPAVQVLARGVVPAVWPAVFSGAVMWGLREVTEPRLGTLVMLSATGAAVYVGLFAGMAIGAQDRALYVQKARELIGHRDRAVPPKAPVTGAVFGGQ